MRRPRFRRSGAQALTRTDSVIPRCPNVEMDAPYPDIAVFAAPRPSDISDEDGFGFFRDVWKIVGGRKPDVMRLLADERALSEVADTLATDEHEFDAIAKALEWQDLEEADLSEDVQSQLVAHIREDNLPLRGLELGVSGLVHALACSFMFPAASCRGHASPHGWARHPAVYFACRPQQAKLLAPLLEQAGVGVSIDAHRPELIALVTPSIVNTMNLAASVMEQREAFRPPKVPRERARAASYGGEQAHLF